MTAPVVAMLQPKYGFRESKKNYTVALFIPKSDKVRLGSNAGIVIAFRREFPFYVAYILQILGTYEIADRVNCTHFSIVICWIGSNISLYHKIGSHHIRHWHLARLRTGLALDV